jgi:hypothetical protein
MTLTPKWFCFKYDLEIGFITFIVFLEHFDPKLLFFFFNPPPPPPQKKKTKKIGKRRSSKKKKKNHIKNCNKSYWFE